MHQRSTAIYRRSRSLVEGSVHGGDDDLNRSWDTAGRFRLQEAGLALSSASRHAEALGEAGNSENDMFRVQIELGLHEVTAVLSSLSRRLASLEEVVAQQHQGRKESEKEDAAKALERNARRVSQALPGIISARARRKALHAFFRDSDEQHDTAGTAIDSATRVLVVEALAHLAGRCQDGQHIDWTAATSVSAYRERHSPVARENARNCSRPFSRSPVRSMMVAKAGRQRSADAGGESAREARVPSFANCMKVEVDSQCTFPPAHVERSQRRRTSEDGQNEFHDFWRICALDEVSSAGELVSVVDRLRKTDDANTTPPSNAESVPQEDDKGTTGLIGNGERLTRVSRVPLEASHATSSAHSLEIDGVDRQLAAHPIDENSVAQEKEIVARILLDAAGLAVEAEEQRGRSTTNDKGASNADEKTPWKRRESESGSREPGVDAVRALSAIQRSASSSPSTFGLASPRHCRPLSPALPLPPTPPLRQVSAFALDDDRELTDHSDVESGQFSSDSPHPKVDSRSVNALKILRQKASSTSDSTATGCHYHAVTALSAARESLIVSTDVEGTKYRPGQSLPKCHSTDSHFVDQGGVGNDKFATDAQGFLDLGALQEEGPSASLGARFVGDSEADTARVMGRMQVLLELEERLRQEEVVNAAASSGSRQDSETDRGREFTIRRGSSDHFAFKSAQSPSTENPISPAHRIPSHSKMPCSARAAAPVRSEQLCPNKLPREGKVFCSGVDDPDHPGSAPRISQWPIFDAKLKAEFVNALASQVANFDDRSKQKAAETSTIGKMVNQSSVMQSTSSVLVKDDGDSTGATPSTSRQKSLSDAARTIGVLYTTKEEGPNVLCPDVGDAGSSRFGARTDSVEKASKVAATARFEAEGWADNSWAGEYQDYLCQKELEQNIEEDVADTKTWAQEYHEYLCQKESDPEAAAATTEN